MSSPDHDVPHMVSLGLRSTTFKTTCGSEVFSWYRFPDGGSEPWLVLIHGYPQTNYMWRHLVPLLPKDVPLFIPDIPGYGRSSPSQSFHDKRTIGRAILEALKDLSKSTSEKQIVIAGHDRGARICHRLAVDNDQHFENFNICGVILLDIIPTLVQWESFKDPKASMTSFHWPLLANVELATAMIMGQGGDIWCREGIKRWSGSDPHGRIRAHQAMEMYSFFMKQETVIQASCSDYRAGAQEDIELQREDQASNRKLTIETWVIFSDGYLASRYNVVKIWEEWSKAHEKLIFYPIRDGVGHFLAEEGPQQTAHAFNLFFTRLRSKGAMKGDS